MTLSRVLITAVVVENRSVADVAASYGVSRSWLYELLARYRREGEAAFEPRSRRPRSAPTALSADVVDLIIRLRKDPKKHYPLAVLAAQWRHRANAVLSTGDPAALVAAATNRQARDRGLRVDDLASPHIEALVDDVLARLHESRSTWTR